jgi:type II secretory pathway pseudopilin PulG
MIILLIIGLLAAIAVPQWITARQNARLRVVLASLKQVEEAKQNWAMQNGKVGADVPTSGELAPDYIKKWPHNTPVTGTYVANAVSSDATFKGKTTEQWLADPSGL